MSNFSRVSRLSSAGSPILLSTLLTGLTNIVTPLEIQASGSIADLGRFAIATVPMLVGLAISRSITSQNLLRGSSLAGVRGLRPTLLWLVALATATTLVILLSFGLAAQFYVLLLATPAGIAQDIGRQRAFGRRAPWAAALADLLWFCAVVVPTLLVVALGTMTTATALDLYAAGAVIGLSTIALATRGAPSAGLDADAVSVGALTLDASAIFTLGQISSILAAALLPIHVLGLVRSAGVLLTPLSFFGNFTQSFLIPRLKPGVRPHREALLALTVGVGLTVAAALVVVVTPDAVLAHFGFVRTPTYIATVLVYGMGFALGGPVAIELVHYRSRVSIRGWLPARLMIAVMEPIVSVPLALLVGSPGLAVNLLVANGLMLWYITRQLGRSRSRDRRS